MLVLLPVGLLIFGALGIVILQITRPGFGYTWLTSVVLSMAVWITTLILRWVNPGVLVIPSWSTLLDPYADLDFGMTGSSWMYAFSLVSLLLAVNITAPVRTRQHSAPWLWAGNMIIIAAGFMVTLAINPLTLILVWTLVDMIEMIMIIGAGGVNIRTITSFATRITGTLVVVWAMIISRSQGEVLTLSSLSPQMGLYLLLAVSLRLGVVPLQIHYSRIMPQLRGQNTILRLVVAASSLVVLGRLPNLVMPIGWALFLSGFTALAALYGSAMWLSAKDEMAGRPYWLVALGGMAVACVVRGQSAASTAWGIAMILSGSVIFLFATREKGILFAPLLGFVGLAGLPFMPSASGWPGLVVFPFSILDIIFLLAHAMLLLGYLRHSLMPGKSMSGMENWVGVIYPVGLMILVIAQWIINVTNIGLAFPAGVWWAGLVSLAVVMICFILYFRFRKEGLGQSIKQSWLISITRSLGNVLAGFFSLEWAYRAVVVIYQITQGLINSLTAVLEGDGGILWSVLLLALFISLFRQGGFP